jgi:hypothetical protein
MRFRRRISIPALAVVLAFFSFAFTPRAGASTPFAITATNVTMPASGDGASSFSVTGIPLTGTLIMSCQYSGSQTAKLKIPYCDGGPVASIPVTAGETYTGTWYFTPWNSVEPVNGHRTGRKGSSTAILSLAGAMLFGLGFRRRFRHSLLALLIALCAFAILPVISACGNGSGMTPGTYPYTLTAANQVPDTSPPVQIVTTTISVTVP